MKLFQRFISQWLITALLLTLFPLSANAMPYSTQTLLSHSEMTCCGNMVMQSDDGCLSSHTAGDMSSHCQSPDCHSTTSSVAALFAYPFSLDAIPESHDYGDPIAQVFNYSERILRPPMSR